MSASSARGCKKRECELWRERITVSCVGRGGFAAGARALRTNERAQSKPFFFGIGKGRKKERKCKERQKEGVVVSFSGSKIKASSSPALTCNFEADGAALLIPSSA